MNKRIAWGTMLTMILVCMFALTISINVAKAIYNPIADLNDDNVVDGFDIAIVAAAFGSRTENSRYNAAADIAAPFGQIDGRDLVLVAQSFGSVA